jgi:glycosyltransferase involved in cell wall biosynthesis
VAAAPLISVVIATRDAAATLPRCLDSLRRQTFRDFEVVVMDAASADGTVDLLKAAGDVVAAWRSEPDTGIYNAWNKALAVARGEWFCVLGADDWLWDAQALERLAPVLRAAQPEQRIIYSRVRQVDAQGGVVAELGRPWEAFRDEFRSHVCLPHPGLMHRRSLWSARGFDERFRLAGDYEFLLRELKTGDALYVPALTAGQQFGGRTTSPEHFLEMYREIGRALRLHGLSPPPLRWAWFLSTAWLYRQLHALLGDRRARALADTFRRATFRRARYLAGD